MAAQVTDEKLRKKISNQVARFDKKFLRSTEVFGLQVVDFTGTEFDAGLPVAPSPFKSGGTVGVTRNVFANSALSLRRDLTTTTYPLGTSRADFYV